MIERLIAFIVVLAIIAFVMYRGVKNSEKQEVKFKYIFRPKNAGANSSGVINCTGVDDLRKHPMFNHWTNNYHLVVCNKSTTVKMIKQGSTWYEGLVVGWLEEVE